MNRTVFIALLVITLPNCLLSAEPSAFGAGDLSNPAPYGLTPTEETLLENKNKLRTVVVKTNNQANEVDSLRERIDGIQTIIESLSSSSRSNELKLNSLDKKNSDQIKSNNEYEKRLIESIQTNSNLIVVNTNEISRINLLAIEMSKLIDIINAKYVTKDEFNLLVSDVNKFKDLVAAELDDGKKPIKSNLDKMSNAIIVNKAKEFYDKKLYSEADEYYTHLIKKNYKPARSHYMIAESHYYRKNYADAIAYFKKSTSLYSKASYMPTLMLHTAISMEKIGDKSNAIIFYNALIKKFPKDKSAKIAKKNLSSIK